MRLSPEHFKAPYIKPEKAWSEADRIRREFWPSGMVPVEVEEILDGLGLRLEPIHSLKESGDVDALLRGDLTTIIVDAGEYMDDRMQNRIRFSLAHELGHFVLHADLYKGISHASVEEWIDFVQRIPEDQYSWIELQAYEFAGHLLVPVDRLKQEMQTAGQEAAAKGFSDWDQSGEAALEYIANPLSRVFGVSGRVIEKRITKERLWPPLQR